MLPYVRILAEIQASPFQPSAPVRSSEVLSFAGSSRRKRSEIALAIDNHSVGLYDVGAAQITSIDLILTFRQVRTGNTVASYAVSPATTFTCPSASIKLRQAGSIEARRVTYSSVLDPQPKLLRFVEDLKTSTRQGGQLQTSAFNLPQDGSAIVQLEVIATHHTEREPTIIDVLCIYEDGKIRCYDEALESEKWTVRVGSTHNGDQKNPGLKIMHASTISIQQARQGILSNREDILSGLDAGQDMYAPNLILLLTRSRDGTLTICILAIKSTEATSSEAFLSDRGTTEELVSFTIPEPIDVRGTDAFFRLHIPSGSLYQGTARNLSVYDLTALTPRLVQTMNFPNAKGILSYIRVASDTVATIAPDSLYLVDTHFSSFQATYALPMSKQARAKLPKDTKSKSPVLGTAGAHLLSYHSPSSSAIVLLGRSLIAVDLSDFSKSTTPSSASRKRKRGGLLIDAIGRGSISVEERPLSPKSVAHLPRALGQVLDPYQQRTEWEQQKESLDALSEKGDLLAWDQATASTLEDARTSAGNDSLGTHVPDYKVDYALGKIFSATPVESAEQRQDGNFPNEIRLENFPRRTWNCLTQKGLVTIERIEASLKRQGKSDFNRGFKDTDLIQVLADHDPKMDTLSLMLQSPCLLKISEVCHALKTAVARSPTHAESDSTKLLTQGEENVDPHADRMELANSVPNIGSHQLLGDTATSNALLDAIIERCNACPTSLLTKALKRQLSRAELRNLIYLLRIKLAQNGWLQPYTEDRPSTDPHKPYNNKQVSSIGKLLNCAVDSLGTGGWLLNGNAAADDAYQARETITYMKNEISAAMAGVEEATYLQGILGEMLLCGKSALNAQADRPPPALLDWGDGQKAALPLGLKLDHNISLTKVGAGGEVLKRSRRDIGKLKSRKVPEYSFERIAV